MVIGGLAGTLHGSSQVTYVWDICYSRAADTAHRGASLRSIRGQGVFPSAFHSFGMNPLCATQQY